MRVPWIVGVSGASGTPYARAVICALLDAGEPVDLVVSRAARLTLLDETGATVRDAHWKDDVGAWLGRELGDLTYWPAGDLAAGPSSGSYPARGLGGGPGRPAPRTRPGAWWSCRRARPPAPASPSDCPRTCSSGRPRSISRSGDVR